MVKKVPSRSKAEFAHAAQYQRAIMYLETGQTALAALCCNEILKADRKNFDVIFLLAIIALTEGNFCEAVEKLQKALKINPRSVDAQYNLGSALSALGRHEEALKAYTSALSIAPDLSAAVRNRALSMYQLGRYHDALSEFDRLLATDHADAELWDSRGLVLRSLGRDEESLECHKKAITLQPLNPKYHFHNAVTLSALKRHESALESYDEAVRLWPDFADAHSNRGSLLVQLARFDEALESLDRAISIQPDNAGARLNKGLLLLLLGRMDEGWQLYEWRKRTLDVKPYPEYSSPLWLGKENISGKTVLVHSEQGLGDTIQFCRYAKIASQMGAKVILAVPDILVDLIELIGPPIEVISINSKPKHFDYFIPLASMMLACKTTIETIPSFDSYLQPPIERIEKWKRRIGDDGFRIAICWQGSPGYLDQGRSFPLTMFQEISKIQNVRLISVQKNAGAEQLLSLPDGMHVETLGEDFDFVDTAAVMHAVDLVISTDTASAHLAGALGRPAWVALKHVPDWRWSMHGSATAWHPSLRLFRQKTSGDWKGVFSEICDALRSYRHEAGSNKGVV